MIAEEEEIQETQDMEAMGWKQLLTTLGHGRCYQRGHGGYWDVVYQVTRDGRWFAASRTHGLIDRVPVSLPFDSPQAAAVWLDLELSK